MSGHRGLGILLQEPALPVDVLQPGGDARKRKRFVEQHAPGFGLAQELRQPVGVVREDGVALDELLLEASHLPQDRFGGLRVRRGHGVDLR